MATIIHFRDSRRSTDADREDRTLTWLVSSLLLALAIVLGAPTVGLVVAGIFFIGTLLAHLEHRPLQPAEFVAIATLHAVAVVLMAF